jgi:hypothetical protein
VTISKIEGRNKHKEKVMKTITITFNALSYYSIPNKLIELIEQRYQTRIFPKREELTVMAKDTASIVKTVLALESGYFNITRLNVKEHNLDTLNSRLIASALLSITQHNIRYAQYLLNNINYDVEV